MGKGGEGIEAGSVHSGSFTYFVGGKRGSVLQAEFTVAVSFSEGKGEGLQAEITVAVREREDMKKVN